MLFEFIYMAVYLEHLDKSRIYFRPLVVHEIVAKCTIVAVTKV